VIVGIGLDLTETARVVAIVARWGDRFTHRVFTETEREFAADRANPAEHLAARFAAKEATIKALGAPPGLRFTEMGVVGGGRIRPEMVLSGRAQLIARELGVDRLHLTLTHTKELAAAVVVAEADSPSGG
jgi:holo-[acyl-carrier protein] synthase